MTLTAQPAPATDATADVLAILVEAAVLAGALVLPFFRHGEKTTAAIHSKAGGSPVTDADILADRFLQEQLTRAFPQAGWLSEESVDDPARLACRDVLIVDPIDGTRGFLNGDPRWTVCIALVRDGRPIAGVVHAPALGETFAAGAGLGATRNGVKVQTGTARGLDGARVAGPHFFLEELARNGIVPQAKIPSLAYRLVQVADASLDVALASHEARDWDIAAADLIVCEAGGTLLSLAQRQPRYNRADTVHPVLVATTPALVEPSLAAVRLAAHALGML